MSIGLIYKLIGYYIKGAVLIEENRSFNWQDSSNVRSGITRAIFLSREKNDRFFHFMVMIDFLSCEFLKSFFIFCFYYLSNFWRI